MWFTKFPPRLIDKNHNDISCGDDLYLISISSFLFGIYPIMPSMTDFSRISGFRKKNKKKITNKKNTVDDRRDLCAQGYLPLEEGKSAVDESHTHADNEGAFSKWRHCLYTDTRKTNRLLPFGCCS